jgi:sporulation protein YlmC with PRC-barrel domain
MKLQTFSGLSAAALLVCPALAQDTKDSRISEPPVRQRCAAKASDVIHMTVKNKQSEILGQVDDLVVDVETGRIVLVILSTGGSLKSVPPVVLQHDVTAKSLCLDASQQKLRGAPVYEMAKSSEFNNPDYLLASYRHFEQSPSFQQAPKVNVSLEANGRESQDIKPTAQRVHWQKVSGLISMPVKNYQGESLGQVKNLLLDFPAGRVVALVISSGTFIGRDGELSAVPPGVIRFTPDKIALEMSGWKEAMIRSPHFKPAEWPDFSDPTYIRHVYGAYQMRPYFADEENASARGVK